MLVALIPLVLVAAAADPPALPPRYLTLGVRSMALAEAWRPAPDLSHAGGGFGIFTGFTALERVEVRSGVDLRRGEDRFGFCLAKCGHPWAEPPARADFQVKLVPFFDVRLHLVELGPVGLVVGMSELFPLSTSLDGRDPVTIGLVNGFLGGLRIVLREGWSFDASLQWETGMHYVPDAPVAGHSSAFVVSASFVYRFPDALDARSEKPSARAWRVR